MKTYAVFFDADGTIYDIKTGIQNSTISGIKKLVENGHQAWLCTGRTRAFIPRSIEAIPFTGMICGAGCTVEKEGKRLINKEMTKEEAWLSVQILRKYGLVPVLEGVDYIYFDIEEYSNSADWFTERTIKRIGEHYRPITGNEDNLKINKIVAKIRPGCDLDAACSELETYYDIIHHENGPLARTSIELLPKGYNKAVGIEHVLKLENIPRENSICFGDSNNDIEMFQYTACKIAMGNSSEKILRLADYVTSDIFNDGVWEGLNHLNLI